MSNDKFKPPKPVAGSGRVVLSIMLDPDAPSDKNFLVSGPFENGVLFLGMLEMAKMTLAEHRAQAAQTDERRIVIPQIIPSGN